MEEEYDVYTEQSDEVEEPGAEIQSNGAVALVFFSTLFLVFFFENIFGAKGFWKVVVAAVVAFLFRNYWYIVWGAVISGLETWGLGDLIH